MSSVDAPPSAARTPEVRTGGRTGGLMLSEIGFVLRRGRHLALLGALAAVPVLIAVAVALVGSPETGEGPPLLDSVTRNGLFVGLVGLLVCIPIFLPLAVGVVAGDTVAGEASLGTLRYLLVAPAGRTRLLFVKLASAFVFCAVACLTIVLVGAVVGVALFGAEAVPLLSGTSIGPVEALGRALLVAAYATLSLLGLAAVGVMVSTLVDNPVGAMATTVVASIVAQVVSTIPQLAVVHPWLFSAQWFDVSDLLRDPIAWGAFADNALLQAGWVLVATSIAWARFRTRDVLS